MGALFSMCKEKCSPLITIGERMVSVETKLDSISPRIDKHGKALDELSATSAESATAIANIEKMLTQSLKEQKETNEKVVEVTQQDAVKTKDIKYLWASFGAAVLSITSFTVYVVTNPKVIAAWIATFFKGVVLMSTIVTTLIGIVAGLLKSWVGAAMENNIRKHEMLMEAKGFEFKERVRAGNLKGVSFTRRFIAISFTFSLVLAPTLYAFLIPDAMITIPVITKEYSFWSMLLPWGSPVENIQYKQVPAMAFIVSLYDMYALIIGFYFGSGGSKIR